MVKTGLAVAVSVLLSTQVAAADPIKVAIVPGIAVNLDAARVDALSQDLAESLAAELDVTAVGGLDVRRLLPADGLPPDCVTTPACVADVAKRVGVSQLLFVVMVNSGAGGSVQIDPTWIDASSGKNASRPAIDLTSTSDTDAKLKFATVAHLLLPDAAVRVKPVTGIGGQLTGGSPRHVTRPAMITAAAAVVGLGVGIGFGLRTSSKYSACETAAKTTVCDTALRDQIRSSAMIADIGWGVAVAGAVATLALYVTSGEGPHLVVSPTPEGGVALTAFGSF